MTHPSMSIEEYAHHLADQAPPVSDEVLEAAARIIAGVPRGEA